jgi:serine/threonine-protein kinase
METGTSLATGGAIALPERLEKYGRYYLVDKLATGGMADVYRAVTRGVEGFRRTFVVKRILTEKASSPSFVRMFCDEARVCALLNHPNIVQVYDFGHVGGTYFLAMEYLLGKDVSSLMRVLRAAKVAVPPAIATYIAREAAIGLHHAHTLRNAAGQALGIVHRDVTPSNIMLLYAGGVKLLDFGIARVGAAVASEGGGIKGKFGYLAPEQARSAADIDGRADVFALGVTLWEMLAGRRLFAGKDEVETLRNVLRKEVPKPSSIRPEIPAALDAVVLRALERDREARYPSAEAMAQDCSRVLESIRCDSQTLRAFLNDLFAEESSSLSLDVPEIPEELFSAAISGPISAYDRKAKDKPLDVSPRNDVPSAEIEIIEPSGPTPRARTPAPPFGVLAADEDPAAASRRRSRRMLAIGGAALAVAVAALVGATHLRPRAPAPAAAREVVAAPIPAPPPPPVAEVPVTPPPAPPAAEAPAAPVVAAPAAPEAAPHRTHRPRKRLSEDLTINPF